MKPTSSGSILALGLAVGLTVIGQDTIRDTRAHAQSSESPQNIIAAQIRRQGFKCDDALSAERDPQFSKPDEPVWTLKCSNATYRVRLIPNLAAKVEVVD